MRRLVVRSTSGCSCVRQNEGIPSQLEHEQTRVLANAATEYFRIASDRSRSDRRGSIMTLFAVLLFALLPLMALIIHTGFVTLTRRQMQTAVNTAALEGLRFRDNAPDSWTTSPPADLVNHCGAPPSDPASPEFRAWLNCARRWSASRLVTAVYDDNFDSSDGDALRLGAGPDFAFEDELTDIPVPGTEFKASRTIRSDNFDVYDPELQLNENDNERRGDMVSGQYVADGCHEEDGDYFRGDFQIDGDTAPNPFQACFPPSHNTFDSAIGDDAFLVRLRRTNDALGHDNVSNVSSSRQPIPFLFGRGGITRAVDDPDPAALWNRRERGTIVRATAIAQALPALTVGPWSSDVGAGAAPIWVEQSQWDGLMDDDATNVTISGSTLLYMGMSLFGEFVDREVVAVGDTLASAAAESISGERYVPVYRVISGNRYVIGFGLADLAIDSMSGGTITRRASRIGVDNCSAHWRQELSAVPPADLTELLANRNSQQRPLLAPALVRTID